MMALPFSRVVDGSPFFKGSYFPMALPFSRVVDGSPFFKGSYFPMALPFSRVVACSPFFKGAYFPTDDNRWNSIISFNSIIRFVIRHINQATENENNSTRRPLQYKAARRNARSGPPPHRGRRARLNPRVPNAWSSSLRQFWHPCTPPLSSPRPRAFRRADP